MSDPLTRQLQPASFRGIQFFVRSEGKSVDGRRRILHEYPNSDKRFVEDLGKIPQQFTLDAFVHGINFLQSAAALRNALKTEAAGRLVLPTFSSYLAYALEFSEDASQKAVGEIKFSIKFALGTNVSGPSEAIKTIEDVYELGDIVREQIAKQFEISWQEPFQTANVIVAQFDTLTLVASVDNIISGVISTAEEIKTISNRIRQGITTLVRDATALPQAIFTEIEGLPGLFQSVSTALTADLNALSSILSLTQFGSDLLLSVSTIKRSKPENEVRFMGTGISLWPETTAERLKRNENRKLLVQSARIAALTSGYEQVAASNYDTKVEVANARIAIEAVYKELYQEQVDDITALQNKKNVRNALQKVRDASLTLLTQKEQQAFGLTEIQLKAGLSAYQTSWELYGETFTSFDALAARTSKIRQLNTAQSAINFIDDVEVFQVQQPVV